MVEAKRVRAAVATAHDDVVLRALLRGLLADLVAGERTAQCAEEGEHAAVVGLAELLAEDRAGDRAGDRADRPAGHRLDETDRFDERAVVARRALRRARSDGPRGGHTTHTVR